MVIYMLWACGVLGVIYKANQEFYELMVDGKIEVGDLVQELSKIFKFSGLQVMIWWLSIFTIITSIIGVGLGLTESYNSIFQKKIRLPKLISAIITIIPAYMISTIVPNAFIKTLSVAGAILVVIAILLPTYLFFKAKIQEPYIRIINKALLVVCMLLGTAIILIELL